MSKSDAVHQREMDIAASQTRTLDTLARTLWGEARGEGKPGMEAVANVVLNRANRPGWWGRSIEGVCTKPWQFSCWLPEDPNLPKLLNVTEANPSFVLAKDIATRAIAGKLPDSTNGATHYHHEDIKPKWAEGHAPCCKIGAHYFYNGIE